MSCVVFFLKKMPQKVNKTPKKIHTKNCGANFQNNIGGLSHCKHLCFIIQPLLT